MSRHLPALLCALLLPILALPAAATPRQEVLQGPITGEVLKVLDGDTLLVKARVWIGQEIETSVRIKGIDAPEMHGKCARERDMAEKARQEVITLTEGQPVQMYNVRLEKYAGRVLAEVQTSGGVNVAAHMIEKGLARPYQGAKRQPWCAF